MIKGAELLSEWPDEEKPEGTTLKGIPASLGVAEGPAKVICGREDLVRLKTGSILLCPSMSPEITMVFSTIKGMVSDQGSPLASAAIIAREDGIPAVTGTWTATEFINDGDVIRVDGTMGRVDIISRAQ